MQANRGPAAVLERAAIAGIEITLRRKSIGEHHVMRRQLNVEIAHARDRLLDNAIVVHQADGRDQDVIDMDRMIG